MKNLVFILSVFFLVFLSSCEKEKEKCYKCKNKYTDIVSETCLTGTNKEIKTEINRLENAMRAKCRLILVK